MGWRRGENWFDGDAPWFHDSTDGAAASLEVNAPAFFGLSLDVLADAIPDGLAASRRRRAELRRRRSVRKTQTAAIVIGPAMLLGLASPRLGNASRPEVLAQDPPSATFRPLLDPIASPPGKAVPSETKASFPAIRWNRATSHGLPYAGRLSGGTQLPLEGESWVTWNPVADRVPNEPDRLYGNEADDPHVACRHGRLSRRRSGCAPDRRGRHQLSRRRTDGAPPLAPERPRCRRLLPAARREDTATDERATRSTARGRRISSIASSRRESRRSSSAIPRSYAARTTS